MPDKQPEMQPDKQPDEPFRPSLIRQLRLTYLFFLFSFAGLYLFLIFQMTNIANLNELTFDHPFTVSNAVLRVQLNVERIRRMMHDFFYSDEPRKNEILAEIEILELKIDDDFLIIQDRFLGDPLRLQSAIETHSQWRLYRHQTLESYNSNPQNGLPNVDNPLHAIFTADMEYLSEFANGKALEFLSESRINAHADIRVAYILVIVFFLFGLLGVEWTVRGIKYPLHALLDSVGEIQKGDFSRHIFLYSGGSEFYELAQAINEMTLMLAYKNEELEAKVYERTEKLERSLEERNTLIRELYHRTKNNMQVISSIMDLKSDELTQAESVNMLSGLDSKIRAMSLVHEMLYRSEDLSHIYLDEYVRELGTQVFHSFTTRTCDIDFQVDLERLSLNIDFAVPFGLVLNELITNSMKYAFVGKTEGRISIKGGTLPSGGLYLEYRDSGPGLPKEFDVTNSSSMGYVLMHTIIEHQLNGSLQVLEEEGFCCRLTFEKWQYTQRV